MDNPQTIFNQNATLKQPIILRQSVLFLILKLIVLEIFVDLIYAAMRIPEFYFNFTNRLKAELIPFYFAAFLILSVIKIIFITHITLNWLNLIYEIGEHEIKLRWGIFNVKEKIFASSHMQEVTYSQNFLERICNFGSIEIYSPALKQKVTLYKIPNPKKHEEIIRKQLREKGAVNYLVSS